MNEAKQRMIRSLSEAQACEQNLARSLESQIASAPRGSHRKGLQALLRETNEHTRNLELRLGELGRKGGGQRLGIGVLGSALGPFIALGRAPWSLLRGSAGPEAVLHRASDSCGIGAVQVARYASVERIARSIGDRETARLAASIRADEQRMLDQLLEEIPALTSWVVEADVRGKAAGAISENGASKPARAKRTARARTATQSKRKAKPATPAPRPVKRAAGVKTRASRAGSTRAKAPAASASQPGASAASPVDRAAANLQPPAAAPEPPAAPAVQAPRPPADTSGTPGYSRIATPASSPAPERAVDDQAQRERAYGQEDESGERQHDGARKELASA